MKAARSARVTARPRVRSFSFSYGISTCSTRSTVWIASASTSGWALSAARSAASLTEILPKPRSKER